MNSTRQNSNVETKVEVWHMDIIDTSTDAIVATK